MVVNNQYINGLVIRPGCVYGKQGGMTNDWFNSMQDLNEINIVGDGTNHWPMIHVDDLAHAYLLAAEKNIGGEIFNIADENSHSVNEIIFGIKALMNFSGNVNYIPLKKAISLMGTFAEALAIDQKIDTSKAQQILNWRPKHSGFYNELNLYYSTWKAFKENKKKR
jgi:nucleoside-diphosphate-sugar epimerase